MNNVPILKADTDAGEGAVIIPKGFSELYPLLRADLLKDWIFQLEKEYRKAMRSLGKKS